MAAEAKHVHRAEGLGGLHRIIKQFVLEGTLKLVQLQSPATGKDTFRYSRLFQALVQAPAASLASS